MAFCTSLTFFLNPTSASFTTLSSLRKPTDVWPSVNLITPMTITESKKQCSNITITEAHLAHQLNQLPIVQSFLLIIWPCALLSLPKFCYCDTRLLRDDLYVSTKPDSHFYNLYIYIYLSIFYTSYLQLHPKLLYPHYRPKRPRSPNPALLFYFVSLI